MTEWTLTEEKELIPTSLIPVSFGKQGVVECVVCCATTEQSSIHSL